MEQRRQDQQRLAARIERCRYKGTAALNLSNQARDPDMQRIYRELAGNWLELADILERIAFE
jgi:hypothetical protein